MLKICKFLFVFCKICICLKILENIQISVNMIDRLNITDEYSVKCDFILNTVIFIDAALNFSLRKFWKCNVLWFCLFGQGVPNEAKGTINLKSRFYCHEQNVDSYSEITNLEMTLLTHISLASLFSDLGKQYLPRSDGALCLIRGYTVCLQEFLVKIKSEWKSTPETP